tara:strand:+ start:294 stop:770 length:477 start_codon:yes stop_codon:yes gene_type:complete
MTAYALTKNNNTVEFYPTDNGCLFIDRMGENIVQEDEFNYPYARNVWQNYVDDGYTRCAETEAVMNGDKAGFDKLIWFDIGDPSSPAAKRQGKWYFDNDYAVSVIQSSMIYSNYEIGIMKKNLDGEYDMCYTTPITNDVIPCDTEDEVTQIMQKVEAL